MSTLLAIGSDTRTGRYEALLRVANAIGSCRDCDTTADVLIEQLREVIAFDYLQLVAFDSESNDVRWRVLYANGQRKDASLANIAVEGTPIGWAHEYQGELV